MDTYLGVALYDAPGARHSEHIVALLSFVKNLLPNFSPKMQVFGLGNPYRFLT
jgi:hypothetical protein